MKTPQLYNVLELYAETPEQAKEAAKRYKARSETLNIMYENIKNLHAASLDTKNYIYDLLLPKVYAIIK